MDSIKYNKYLLLQVNRTEFLVATNKYSCWMLSFLVDNYKYMYLYGCFCVAFYIPDLNDCTLALYIA